MDKADPYVKLTLGSEAKRTSVKENAGGNVMYRETFTFNKALVHETLQVSVVDKDTMSDETLGVCLIDLHQMQMPAEFESEEPVPFQVGPEHIFF